MTDYNAMTDEDFRAEVRRFVESEYPAHLRNPPHRLHWQEGRSGSASCSGRAGWRRAGRRSSAAWGSTPRSRSS
ncbi:hypothetical protein [Teichococcus aestuarii]|uniref:hypothetical protein n=1 Tax=Teichococcus aestuarii TaxID=568898 RepID=UPI00361C2941